MQGPTGSLAPTAFAVRVGSAFEPITLGDFVADVRAAAAGFLGLGLEPGTRVCVFSRTRYEFTVLDFAILAAGCVMVPIYESDSADQVRWVVGNSQAAAILIEDAALRNQFDAVAADVPDCKHVFVIESGGIDELRAHGQASRPTTSTGASGRSPTSTWPRSSTPPARPGSRRAACSPTAT